MLYFEGARPPIEPIRAYVIPEVILLNRELRGFTDDTYYPRLQVNSRGEIILALSRSKRGLTTGILVGKTSDHNSTTDIGKKWVDWEVACGLTDYDGNATVTFKNLNKKE